jgi:hypothetical protein
MSADIPESDPSPDAGDHQLLKQMLEQVERIGQRLQVLEAAVLQPRQDLAATKLSLSEASVSTEGEDRTSPTRQIRRPLPDPRLVRAIIRNRHLRKRHITSKLFADPAWDMLLDLTVAYAEHTRTSITSLCIASGVPQATALRWINLLVAEGLVQRIEDYVDRRRVFAVLTEQGANAMADLFGDLEHHGAGLV